MAQFLLILFMVLFCFGPRPSLARGRVSISAPYGRIIFHPSPSVKEEDIFKPSKNISLFQKWREKQKRIKSFMFNNSTRLNPDLFEMFGSKVDRRKFLKSIKEKGYRYNDTLKSVERPHVVQWPFSVYNNDMPIGSPNNEVYVIARDVARDVDLYYDGSKRKDNTLFVTEPSYVLVPPPVRKKPDTKNRKANFQTPLKHGQFFIPLHTNSEDGFDDQVHKDNIKAFSNPSNIFPSVMVPQSNLKILSSFLRAPQLFERPPEEFIPHRPRKADPPLEIMVENNSTGQILENKNIPSGISTSVKNNNSLQILRNNFLSHMRSKENSENAEELSAAFRLIKLKNLYKQREKELQKRPVIKSGEENTQTKNKSNINNFNFNSNKVSDQLNRTTGFRGRLPISPHIKTTTKMPILESLRTHPFFKKKPKSSDHPTSKPPLSALKSKSPNSPPFSQSPFQRRPPKPLSVVNLPGRFQETSKPQELNISNDMTSFFQSHTSSNGNFGALNSFKNFKPSQQLRPQNSNFSETNLHKPTVSFNKEIITKKPTIDFIRTPTSPRNGSFSRNTLKNFLKFQNVKKTAATPAAPIMNKLQPNSMKKSTSFQIIHLPPEIAQINVERVNSSSADQFRSEMLTFNPVTENSRAHSVDSHQPTQKIFIPTTRTSRGRRPTTNFSNIHVPTNNFQNPSPNIVSSSRFPDRFPKIPNQETFSSPKHVGNFVTSQITNSNAIHTIPNFRNSFKPSEANFPPIILGNERRLPAKPVFKTGPNFQSFTRFPKHPTPPPAYFIRPHIPAIQQTIHEHPSPIPPPQTSQLLINNQKVFVFKPPRPVFPSPPPFLGNFILHHTPVQAFGQSNLESLRLKPEHQLPLMYRKTPMRVIKTYNHPVYYNPKKTPGGKQRPQSVDLEVRPSLRDPSSQLPPSQGQQVASSDTYETPTSYRYKYIIDDPVRGIRYGHAEMRRGANARGEYFVTLPDGTTQMVKYTSDVEGYKANVKYLNAERDESHEEEDKEIRNETLEPRETKDEKF